ncbi:MAG: four helix bundle protein [Thermotogae bacterium]|nr:four helix bundle protein [Thermotogota bacterium]
MDLVEFIYRLTEAFPQKEIYGLTNQIRRAVVSVPSNIAEGAARSSEKEFSKFLYISLGSLSEVETQLIIAQRLKYIGNYDDSLLIEIRKMLIGLIKSLKS